MLSQAYSLRKGLTVTISQRLCRKQMPTKEDMLILLEQQTLLCAETESQHGDPSTADKKSSDKQKQFIRKSICSSYCALEMSDEDIHNRIKIKGSNFRVPKTEARSEQ